MRFSDIQPQYFPRLHYVARMLASDVFVIRDDVQFVRNHKYPDGGRGLSYQAHTPVKSPDGVYLLTVSVKNGGLLPIYQTSVSYDQPWVRKHTNAIRNFYRGSPNLHRLMPEIEQLLSCRLPTVADLNIATICWALHHVLGHQPRIPEDLSLARVNELLQSAETVRIRRIARGSDLLGTGPGDPRNASQRIVTLCKAVGADEYLGGRTALQAYLNTALFEADGIQLSIQDWSCPAYGQQHTAQAGFIANLSILDLLMNVPADMIAELLRCDGADQRSGPVYALASGAS